LIGGIEGLLLLWGCLLWEKEYAGFKNEGRKGIKGEGDGGMREYFKVSQVSKTRCDKERGKKVFKEGVQKRFQIL
jgi:hypothetical protein